MPLLLLAISGGSIALFLWQNDLSTMGRAFGSANPLLGVAALGLFLLHHVARAERFGVLLGHIHDCGRWLPMRALTIGVAANSVLPAKPGHVARAHVVSRETPMSKGAVSGSFIVEALFDGLFVLALMLVALAFVPLGMEVRSSVLAFAGFIGLGALLAILAAMGRLPAAPPRLLLRRCPPRFERTLTELGSQAGEGMGLLRSARRVSRVLGATTVAYGLQAAAFLVLARALSLDLSFTEATTVVAVTTMAGMLPGIGGGLGTFEVVTGHTVAAMGFSSAGAAAYAVALHALLVIPLALLGLAFLWAGRRGERRSVSRISASGEIDATPHPALLQTEIEPERAA